MAKRDYQEYAVNALFHYFESNPTGHPVVVMPTGCHARGTRILMFDGRRVPVEDIRVGDQLMGPDSKPRRVLGLSRGRQEMRRICPVVGDSYVVNKDHKMFLRTFGKSHADYHDRIMTVAEYEALPLKEKGELRLYRKDVEFPNTHIPDLDPYVLGLIIGCRFGRIKIKSHHQGVMDRFIAACRADGVGDVYAKREGHEVTLSLINSPRLEDLFVEFGYTLGQDCGFIPEPYLVANSILRRRLLAGLLDSMATLINHTQYHLYFWNETIADQVTFVARSIGLRAEVIQRKDCDFVVDLRGKVNHQVPTRIFMELLAPLFRDPRATQFHVRPLPEDDFFGFTLDGDHLYLTDDFIIHHNTGKSWVIADFIKELYLRWPGHPHRVVMATHVKELVDQNAKTLELHWPGVPVGVYSAGLGQRNLEYPIIFAGIGSIYQRAASLGKVDLLLVDECDLISPNEGSMYRKFINALRVINPNLRVIGFTATPFRAKQGMIHEGDDALFTDIAVDMSSMEAFNWFIDEGYLLPLIPRQTKLEIDISGVRTTGGDFNAKELNRAVNLDDINEAIIQESWSMAKTRKRWLGFACGIEHAEALTGMLKEFGVDNAAFVHSKMPEKERDRVIAAFKAGDLQVLVNNGILTTGFNCPEIDYIMMARHTRSPRLWVQMLGRGTRPVYADGFDLGCREGRLAAIEASGLPNCLVGDFAGNTYRLGPINDPNILKKKKGAGVQPMRTCEVCSCICHPSLRSCPDCGAVFTFDLHVQAVASEQELIRTKADPVFSDFTVERVTYHTHRKSGAPDSLKVTYFCGIRLFTEWICFEHSGFARRKAEQWWKRRTGDKEVPATVAEVLPQLTRLAIPNSIKVRIDSKYPEIKSYVFEGDARDGSDQFTLADVPKLFTLPEERGNVPESEC